MKLDLNVHKNTTNPLTLDNNYQRGDQPFGTSLVVRRLL